MSVVVIPANCECCTGSPACDGTFMDSLPSTLKINFTFPAPFAAYSGEHNLIDPGGTTGTSRIWVFDNIDGDKAEGEAKVGGVGARSTTHLAKRKNPETLR